MTVFAAAHGFGHRVEHGRILQGWALAMQGETAAGVVHIQQGLVAVQGTGLKLHRPYCLSLLAEAYGKVGRTEEGLTALVEALAAVDRTGEHLYEAELYRLKGVLTLQSHVQAPQAEAEACFQKAIEVARQQQAKSLELRAVTSLSRLWQQQGKRVEARQLLAEVYNWFTEGFDTRDLQEAKVLLEELS